MDNATVFTWLCVGGAILGACAVAGITLYIWVSLGKAKKNAPKPNPYDDRSR